MGILDESQSSPHELGGGGSGSDERAEGRKNSCGTPPGYRTHQSRAFDGLFVLSLWSSTTPESHFAQVNFKDPPTSFFQLQHVQTRNAPHHTRSTTRPTEAAATVEIVPSPPALTVHSTTLKICPGYQTPIVKRHVLFNNLPVAPSQNFRSRLSIAWSGADRLGPGISLRLANRDSTRRIRCRGTVRSKMSKLYPLPELVNRVGLHVHCRVQG